MRLIFIFIIFGTSIFANSIELKIKKIEKINLQFSSNSNLTHFVNLDVYLFAQDSSEYQRLIEDLKTAQEIVSTCNIQLNLKRKITITGNEAFREFESLEFNNDRISPYERAIFNLVPEFSSGIILVESLDWTIGDNGTVAVGYAPYILELDILEQEEEKKFLLHKMSGYSVLGKARTSATLAHELGHSLFSLTHNDDPTNMMFPYGFGRSRSAKFDESQCQKARSNKPWVKPL